jgi:hypothetical protein
MARFFNRDMQGSDGLKYLDSDLGILPCLKPPRATWGGVFAGRAARKVADRGRKEYVVAWPLYPDHRQQCEGLRRTTQPRVVLVKLLPSIARYMLCIEWFPSLLGWWEWCSHGAFCNDPKHMIRIGPHILNPRDAFGTRRASLHQLQPILVRFSDHQIFVKTREGDLKPSSRSF